MPEPDFPPGLSAKTFFEETSNYVKEMFPRIMLVDLSYGVRWRGMKNGGRRRVNNWKKSRKWSIVVSMFGTTGQQVTTNLALHHVMKKQFNSTSAGSELPVRCPTNVFDEYLIPKRNRNEHAVATIKGHIVSMKNGGKL
ncbi:601_t:CDS:2, partial [Paraglomus occultum]